MRYYISKNGMMNGYWKIIDENGNTIESGYKSKQAALHVAIERTKQTGSNTYCGSSCCQGNGNHRIPIPGEGRTFIKECPIWERGMNLEL